MNSSEMNYVISEMAKVLNFTFENVDVKDGEGIFISAEESKTVIECSSKTELCRALSVLKKNLKSGNKTFEYREQPVFKTRSIMLDLSRNAVMKVSAVKEYIAYMAAFGLNTVLLYTEDTYELKEYPFLGYMRGRYTKEEFKEIDDYAYSLGVEVIACIQTLGHMEQYLRWQEAFEIKDTRRVMLCEEEKTYKFIETAIKFFSETLRSRKIHIGMDEADEVGTGTYLIRNGHKDRCDIISDHLDKVSEICKKYDVFPMIWSDMYCRIGSENYDHYDTESRLEQSVIDRIPDVEMVYWDYYHYDVDFYRKIIQNHKRMNKPLTFASGIWMWDGLLPNLEYTFRTMVPALKACRAENVESFMATMWGDTGNEANHFFSLFGLAMFAEYAFSKIEPTDEQIYSMLENVTGMKYEPLKVIDGFFCGFKGTVKIGTQLVWSDILIDMIDTKTDDISFKFEGLKEFANSESKWKEYYLYALKVMEIAEIKRTIRSKLKPAYKSGNKAYLKELAENILPSLKPMYESLAKIHEKQWKDTYKVFGWEIIHSRYCVCAGRIDYAIRTINMYLGGEIDIIEELEPETLYQKEPSGKYFRSLVSTSEIF